LETRILIFPNFCEQLNMKMKGPKLVQIGEDGENVFLLRMISLKRAPDIVMIVWIELMRLEEPLPLDRVLRHPEGRYFGLLIRICDDPNMFPDAISQSAIQGLIGQFIRDIDRPMSICNRAAI
jgi:hypothetical protein